LCLFAQRRPHRIGTRLYVAVSELACHHGFAALASLRDYGPGDVALSEPVVVPLMPTLGSEFGATLPPVILAGVEHAVVDNGRDRTVLAEVSRRFAAGSLHVVGGPPGSGKAALLSILSLALRPTRGAVLWGDIDLTAMRAAQQTQWRRRNLGLVLDTSSLVGVMTVRDHIRLAASIRRRPDAEAEGLAILGTLGMGAQLNRLPAQLSGGEKQCVALAQALCTRPAILLADDPTAALDGANAALVAYTLRSFARDYNAVVICMSDDPVVMDAADGVLMLENP
jgi:putative ABC transport system ATP-binding protein